VSSFYVCISLCFCDKIGFLNPNGEDFQNLRRTAKFERNFLILIRVILAGHAPFANTAYYQLLKALWFGGGCIDYSFIY